MQNISDDMVILSEVAKINGYKISHFKELEFGEDSPAHYYITFCLKNKIFSMGCSIITSKQTNINIYKKQYPYALESVIKLEKGLFPFLTEDVSYLDCNECKLFYLDDLKYKLCPVVGFKVKNYQIPKDLIKTIKTAIQKSDIVPDKIKNFVP